MAPDLQPPALLFLSQPQFQPLQAQFQPLQPVQPQFQLVQPPQPLQFLKFHVKHRLPLHQKQNSYQDFRSLQPFQWDQPQAFAQKLLFPFLLLVHSLNCPLRGFRKGRFRPLYSRLHCSSSDSSSCISRLLVSTYFISCC